MASLTTKYVSKLANARVLILGGTSGIGFCVAEAALEQGALVTISSSRPPKLEGALSRLRASYPSLATKVNGYTCDLSSESTVESNIENLLKLAAGDGKINHIVFTAGDAIKITPVSEVTVTSIQKTGMVRFVAPLLLAKYASKYLVPGPASSITLTGGTMSHRPQKNWTVIAGWGSGVEGVTRGLAVDLAPVRVNMVSPGAVHTELFDDIPKEALDNVLEKFREGTLVGKVGRPEDLAEAFIYCMRCDFVTGSIVVADGGRLLK